MTYVWLVFLYSSPGKFLFFPTSISSAFSSDSPRFWNTRGPLSDPVAKTWRTLRAKRWHELGEAFLLTKISISIFFHLPSMIDYYRFNPRVYSARNVVQFNNETAFTRDGSMKYFHIEMNFVKIDSSTFDIFFTFSLSLINSCNFASIIIASTSFHWNFDRSKVSWHS